MSSVGSSHDDDANLSRVLSTEPEAEADDESPTQRIRGFEAALAALPEGRAYDVARAGIRAQIELVKRDITLSKPLPNQLAACAAALERAKNRRTKSYENLTKAKEEYQVEDSKVAEIEAEYKRIEASLSSAKNPPLRIPLKP